MNVPEITAFKAHMETLKSKGYLIDWELPYENLLTRLNAAIFFAKASTNHTITDIWKELEIYPELRIEENEDKNLSQLELRISFKDGQKR